MTVVLHKHCISSQQKGHQIALKYPEEIISNSVRWEECRRTEGKKDDPEENKHYAKKQTHDLGF